MEDTDTPEVDEDQALMETVHIYVKPMMSVPMQELYIARHCTSKTKEELTEMVHEIIACYKVMLEDETWLGEETRQKAVEKLEGMALKILYPDHMPDYSGLVIMPFEQGGTLLDAYAVISQFESERQSEKVNMLIDRDYWDMQQIETTIVNACYVVEENSINILAGFIADGFAYDSDAPYEQNLARIGAVVGHEISHAFDTNGYRYDMNGLQNNWWTNDDELAFQMRAANLVNYYNVCSILPGMEGGYSGELVKGEVIADMGGVKCMLELAKRQSDFDYELFFTSYAQLWASVADYVTELGQSSIDPHPLSFLRTNVTLQQFDEFFETFDIDPGDGMYLAPEDRILVW